MLGFEGLPRRTRAYVISVAGAATLQCLLFVLHPVGPLVPPDQVLPVVVVCSVLGLLADLKPIVSPAGEKRTVAASLFIPALLLVGPELAMIPVAVSQAGSHLIQRQPFPKLLFNWGQFALSVGLSGTAYLWALGWLGLPRDLTFASPLNVIALTILLAAYYVVNSILVAIVIAMSENRPVVQQYRETNVVVITEYTSEAVVGVIAAVLWRDALWSALLVGFVVVSIYRAYAVATSLQVAQRDLLLRMTELRRRTDELELLNEVNGALTRALDLTQLWELLAEQVGRILDTTSFFVALYDERHGQIHVAFGQDEGTRATGQVIPASSGLSGWVVVHAQPLLIHNYLEERSRYPDTITWGSGKLPVSVLTVPMILDGRVLGVVSAQTYRPNAYTDDDLRLLSAIAGQAAVAINNARLRKEAADAQALKHLNLLKTQFISTVSHELRSPLTPIVGYSEMLMVGAYADAQVQEMAGEINRAAVHMQQLVDDLLDLSRIESGRLKLAIQPIALEDVVNEAVRGFAAVSARHEVRAEIGGPLPVISADPFRIRQVLNNLLSNAVKYFPEGGLVLVQAWTVGDEVRVSVKDKGLGIPQDKLSRLFEMFYRVDSDLTRRVSGTGLGLAISRHIVESHGGRIWVESEVGRGSTFYFSLPASPRTPSAASFGVAGQGEPWLQPQEVASEE